MAGKEILLDPEFLYLGINIKYSSEWNKWSRLIVLAINWFLTIASHRKMLRTAGAWIMVK